MSTTASKDTDDRELRGGPIVQTNRVFVKVTQMGHCRADGKSVMSLGFAGKQIALPERALSTIGVCFIGELVSLARYRNNESLLADLNQFKAFVETLEPVKPKAAISPPTDTPTTAAAAEVSQ